MPNILSDCDFLQSQRQKPRFDCSLEQKQLSGYNRSRVDPKTAQSFRGEKQFCLHLVSKQGRPDGGQQIY